MILLHKPGPEEIQQFLDRQRSSEVTYDAIGETAAGRSPAGFDVDHTRVAIGHGTQDFRTARAALEQWEQFRLGNWLQAADPRPPVCRDSQVAVLARSIGLWWLNAARIIYTIDEDQPTRRFGFAYGTLPDHVECGEERFLIEMDADGTVWYDVFAFSHPRHLLARIGYLWVRRLQKRFGRSSAARMKRLVAEASVHVNS